jgi:uncharacterized protein (TIGR00290 family)
MSTSRPKALLSWSSGKDSAWTLEVLRRQGEVEVVGLVTTMNAAAERVAMHAVRRRLLEAQAQSAGLPVWTIDIPSPCSNAEYDAAMLGFLESARGDGVDAMAFGDLFLEDIRMYREQRLAGTGVRPLFPLWRRPTRELAAEMLAAGVRAYITCVDPRQIPAAFAGREWNAALIAELPAGADPCGENGEFHSFVFAGPMLDAPLDVATGEIIERDGFVFADVVLS